MSVEANEKILRPNFTKMLKYQPNGKINKELINK